MTNIRPYQPGDEYGIIDLFKRCHQRDLPVEVWNWRYLKSPLKSIITVVEAEGKIVAHLGVLPERIQRADESLTGGLWVDLMVDPAYRNLSLFLDMAEASRKRSEAEGISLLFAFPNDRSYPVLKRMMDWQTIEEIEALEAPLKDLRDRLADSGSPGGWRVKPVVDFDTVFEELWDRMRPADRYVVPRSTPWLRWRYGEKPGKPYACWIVEKNDGRLAGWMALKVFDDPRGAIGDILDFWTDFGEPAGKALWAVALNYFSERGAASVSAWAMKDSLASHWFNAWGLKAQGPRTHFAGRWTNPKTDRPFPASAAEWSIFKGDSDVF